VTPKRNGTFRSEDTITEQSIPFKCYRVLVATTPTALSGRKAQAARNDTAILDAARVVFMRDASAPVSAVAKRAGVGISALYRRYPSKEDLIRRLCADGLRQYIAAAEIALGRDDRPWAAFAGFLRDVVDADVHALTVNLAGTFMPSAELYQMTERANALAAELLTRAQAAGAVRADLVLNDLAMILEQLTAVRLEDADRTRELRRRYLALHLDSIRADSKRDALPGRPPTGEELGARWVPQ
jgi:AcrR family transcriptional regulator